MAIFYSDTYFLLWSFFQALSNSSNITFYVTIFFFFNISNTTKDRQIYISTLASLLFPDPHF